VIYPPSHQTSLVDLLHGVAVPDPFRWLEDADGSDTAAWTDAQNALTRSVLDGPYRARLVAELTKRFDYPRTTGPVRRGTRYFFNYNPGLLPQAVLYVQDGAAGIPRVLLDPNTLSCDGTAALTAVEPSATGALLAYAVSRDGSDRQDIRVRDVQTGVDLPDRLEWVKFASLAWTLAQDGFFYLRFPEPGSVPPEDEQYFGRIYFHRLGDAQTEDELIFETPHAREIVPLVEVTDDGRFLVVTAQRGASDDSEIHLIDLSRKGDFTRRIPLFTSFDAAYAFVGHTDGRLFFRTTKDAPRGRIIAADAANPSAGFEEIVGEAADRLSTAVLARGTLVATYLHDASDRLMLFDVSGRPIGDIALPQIASIASLDARPDAAEVLLTTTSFTSAPASYRCDLTVGSLTSFGTAGDADAASPVERYDTHHVWYRSRDGTRVSMFLVHRRDLVRDRDRPVLLSGYGGFNISRTPAFDPALLPFLERGGVFALAHLRGGGEYGEDWHRAGMLDRKQNVFDDFIAAAEYLMAEGYTNPKRLAIEGGSNGGLLVAAVMVQRPDLFGAVVCRVPVADMLRYHLFTVGRFWIPEYGSADDPEQFKVLLAYSPYHNVRPGAAYPPVLVMTADTDDRVSPGMAKKFAARLQSSAAGGPFLIRIETKAGHGAGKPVAKMIEEDADILAFLQRAIRWEEESG
jgi:prolyl oligopeptidase